MNVQRIITLSGIGFVALLSLIMGGCPRYKVWERHMAGEAELAQATANRQIAVQEAQAKREAAIELAQAEIERAKGVAGANAIIAESLKGNESYLRYLWITEVASVGKNGKTVVYVPTEANLPILEATRRP
jgi:regulator of protease activity HflC (stomatin/prohibitin superfamily)